MLTAVHHCVGSIMRLLAFTDIHGAYDRVEQILSREQPFDGLIFGGDLTTRGTSREVTHALERFQSYQQPLFAVAGNMDSPSFDRLFDALDCGINGRGRMLQDIGIFGVSGSPPTPMQTPYEIPEDEIARRSELGYREVHAARVHIYVPHAPPFQTAVDRVRLGFHAGSTAVRQFIEQRAPDLVVCGHIHEGRGIDRIGTTQVVNCGPAGNGSYAAIHIDDTIHVDLRL